MASAQEQGSCPSVTVTDSFLKLNLELGEGAIYADGAYLFVDIYSGRAFRFKSDGGSNELKEYKCGEFCSTIIPVDGQPSRAVVALKDTLAEIDFERESDHSECVANPCLACNPDARADVRFNDGKAGPDGQIFVGTMHMNEQREPIAGLYSTRRKRQADTAGTASAAAVTASAELVETMMMTMVTECTGIKISNGICWDSTRTKCYYIDTPSRRVDVLDYTCSQTEEPCLSNRRVAFELAEGTGYPDGMTMDSRDNLWVAHWAGSHVTCYDATTGTPKFRVNLPVSRVTSCAFGGADLRDLFITTAREGMTKEEEEREPLAGDVFLVPASMLPDWAVGVPAFKANLAK